MERHLLPRRGRIWTWTTQEFLPKEPYAGGETAENFKPFGVALVQLDCSTAEPVAHRVTRTLELVDGIARDVDLDRGRLVGADARRSSLAGASLRYADLSHARLDQSTLVGARLAHCNLHRASREGTDTTGADLRGARPTDAARARAEDFRSSP